MNESVELVAGETKNLSAEVYPKTATNKTVLWFTSNPDVATVNEDGTIQAVGKGTTCITAYSYTGNCYMSCLVEISAAGFDLSEDEINVEIGDEIKLEAKYDGVVVNENITWESSNEKIVTVENGYVKAVGEGTGVITAKNASDSAITIIHVYPKGELPNKPDNNTGTDNLGVSLYGDADVNGKVDLNDAKLVLKLALGINAKVTEKGKLNADYDANNKIDLNDAKYTLKKALGIKFTI